MLPATFISGKSAKYNKTSGNNEHLYISIHEGEVILLGLTLGGTHRHQVGCVSRGDNNPSH